jgi:UDP-N-acetylmuramyl pentapeptide synthase
VECGVLEEEINGAFGEEIAKAKIDEVILVGDTLVGAVKTGYLQAGGDKDKIKIVPTLEEAQELLVGNLNAGDCVLFLNDLLDLY